MAEKRRDNKGRILKDGEYQRKDGKYEYKFVDNDGQRKSIYSWKLVSTDKLPDGKRSCIPLRDQIKEISKRVINNETAISVSTITIRELFEEYIKMRTDLKSSSRNTYYYAFGCIKQYENLNVGKITEKELTKILNDISNQGKKTQHKTCIFLLNSLFSFAVNKSYIQKNPLTPVLSLNPNIARRSRKKPSRKTMTKEEQEIYLNYCKARNPLLYLYSVFLIGTGCRCGEFLALKWEDCDFKNKTILVNTSMFLDCTREAGSKSYLIGDPKTETSRRFIPMLPEVEHVLNCIKKINNNQGREEFICQYDNMSCMNTRITNLVKKYNDTETARAIIEDREPVFLPDISPHWFRHTFCSRFYENGGSIKTMQYVLGHSSVSTTLDIYTELDVEYNKKELNDKLSGLFGNLRQDLRQTKEKI